MTPHYKDLVGKLARSLNEQQFEQVRQFYHPDATHHIITPRGGFQEVHGIDAIVSVLQSNFGASNDVIFTIEEMICEASTVCGWGFLKGTTWMGNVLGPFELKAFVVLKFKEDKIIYSHWLPDTFAYLRLIGRASFVSNDEDIINQYLDNLVEMGLIRETDRRLRQP
ncbi:MAG: nuclear transport factor 2 family protein [Candidatus Heimdallarchaeota archaeon]